MLTMREGSYFFRYNCNPKPDPWEGAKVCTLIADIVEDYFMAYGGERFINVFPSHFHPMTQ